MDGNEDPTNNLQLELKAATDSLKDTSGLDNEAKVAELHRHAEIIRNLLARLQMQPSPNTRYILLHMVSHECHN